MACLELDTRPWNLGRSAVAVAAAWVLGCGPTTGEPEGESQAGADAGRDTDDGAGPTASGGEADDGDDDGILPCESDEDCEDPQTCVEGWCLDPSDEDDDGGYHGEDDPDGEYTGDYGDEYGPAECYYSSDCDLGEFCGGSLCNAVPFLPECDELPLYAELPLTGLPSGATDVAFVPGNRGGAAHLVIGSDEGLAVVPAGSDIAAAVVSPTDVHRLATADFDGDGTPDIAVHAAKNVATVLVGDGTGSFTPDASLVIPLTLETMTAARFEGDLPSLLVRADSQSVWLYPTGVGGGSEPLGQFSGPAPDERYVRAGDVDDDGYDDVVLGGAGLHLFLGGESPSYEDERVDFDAGWYGQYLLHPEPLLPPHELGRDVIGVSQYDGWVRVEVWRDSVKNDYALQGNHARGTWGDIDADGDSDLVLVGDSLRVVRGATAAVGADTFYDCYGVVLDDAPAIAVATGDLDGDGRDEIAIVVDGEVTVLTAPG